MKTLHSEPSQSSPYMSLHLTDLESAVISIVLPWVLWVILANYCNWGDLGTLQICSWLVRSVWGLGNPINLRLAYEVSVVLQRAKSLTCGDCANCRWVVPELNFSNHLDWNRIVGVWITSTMSFVIEK